MHICNTVTNLLFDFVQIMVSSQMDHQVQYSQEFINVVSHFNLRRVRNSSRYHNIIIQQQYNRNNFILIIIHQLVNRIPNNQIQIFLSLTNIVPRQQKFHDLIQYPPQQLPQSNSSSSIKHHHNKLSNPA